MSRWEKVGGRKRIFAKLSIRKVRKPLFAADVCGPEPTQHSVLSAGFANSKVRSTQVAFIKNRTESDCENCLYIL